MTRKILSAALAASLAVLVGCGRTDTGNDRPARAKKDDHHRDKPGAHGGRLIVIGDHDYHAEVVAEKDGTLRLFTLARDEKQVQDVDRQELTVYFKAEGETAATAVKLAPAPQPGDAAGKTSQFVGTLPRELRGRALTGIVPSLAVADKRFTFDFRLGSGGHEAAMPASLGEAEARDLYLTPAGKYGEADIAANGRQTAQQKYQNFRARHDLKPKPGDKICPVTFTKANPACTWVIGGQTYEFCCPPCIDEYVSLARDQPDELRPPEHFVKKGKVERQ